MQLASADVSSDHPNLNLIFTQEEVKVNNPFFQQSLKRYVLPLSVAFGSPYVFTDDRAATNTDNTT